MDLSTFKILRLSKLKVLSFLNDQNASFSEVQTLSKMISRKIWAEAKFENFHTVADLFHVNQTFIM